MIVGTAGHIDHGKTSLITALTGIAGDRLKEEKARGITIDLGFTHWPRADGRSIAFIDVPGHEALVGTMIAGAASIDLLLLAVAADDGIMPQTQEHVAIAGLLGIRQAIVVVTKTDLADEDRIAAITAAASALLARAGIPVAATLATSALHGRGITDLVAAMDTALTTLHRRAMDTQFRLVVDRVFTRDGHGTIVTGTILGGSVRADDRLIVQPGAMSLRVRGIQSAGRAVTTAIAGERAALNVAGDGLRHLRRGAVIQGSDGPTATARLDIDLCLLAGATGSLPVWLPVTLHAGAAAMPARLVPLGQGSGGHARFAQLILERGQIAVAVGDRIVLRDAGRQRTMGGGTVLDIAPPARRRGTPQRLQMLTALAAQPAEEAVAQLADVPPYLVDLDAFATARALNSNSLLPALQRHSLTVFRHADRTIAASPALLLRLRRELVEALTRYHERMPEAPGLPAGSLFAARNGALDAEIRAPLAAGLAGHPLLIDAAIGHYRAAGVIERTGPWLRLPHHVPRLSPEHQALWNMVRPLIDGPERHRPPKTAALAARCGRGAPTIRGLLKRLARRGDVFEVAPDQFLLTSAVVELAATVREVAAKSPDGWFGAAAFRDRLETGRKMAILILEFFDRQGLTRREGDRRRLDPRGRDLFREP